VLNKKPYTEEEYVLLLKTLPEMKQDLQIFIQENHSYDIPCIISFDVDVNNGYGEWISEIIKPAS